MNDNVIRLWHKRIRAEIEHKQWPPETATAPMRYVLSCYEIEEGDSIEWMTVVLDFETHEECLARAVAWAGKDALVWDMTTGEVHGHVD